LNDEYLYIPLATLYTEENPHQGSKRLYLYYVTSALNAII